MRTLAQHEQEQSTALFLAQDLASPTKRAASRTQNMYKRLM